jgi:hypothetical protein
MSACDFAITPMPICAQDKNTLTPTLIHVLRIDAAWRSAGVWLVSSGSSRELIVIHRGNRDDGEETFVEWVKCG